MPTPFTVAEIREAYLAFFAQKGCVRYPSASLVPENDPTTLFTVAGMAQFKDMFLGRGTHPFSRATTVQKCIRTNDILNVGRTARHHTFFEMLGNFSFNDYFKRETIGWAWEFLTGVLKLDPNRLSVSVHRIDDEAADIWLKEIGIPANRLFRLGDSDNFWPADAPTQGPEGPGGCCSEIFWDHRINNDPNDNLTSSTGRFVEIWNLVFPQFNVRKPNADGTPNLESLGRTNVDTGSGLERVAAVMQGVYNNFDIDVFQTIIRRVCAVTGRNYDRNVALGTKVEQAEVNALIRRIADHVRAVTFCVADGALPGNSDRGYIVRRLIRRATLDSDKLGVDSPRLFEVVPAVIEAMGTAYPEIVRRGDLATETLKAEEALFRRTLGRGLDLFRRSLDRQKGSTVFSGDDAFELVATHGFPKEVIAELAQAEGLSLDEARFQVRWHEHQQISNTKAVEVFTTTALQEAKPRLGATRFAGYDVLTQRSDLTVLEVDGKAVTSAANGAKVRFALAATPFYAESGGQVADTGLVNGPGFAIAVTDVQKDEGLVIHSGTVARGTAVPGPVTAEVDRTRRSATTRHHSATHLLHAALGVVLGDHVEQQGSKVGPDELRFDFNHPKGLSRDELARVESWVRDRIAEKHPADIRELPIAEAKSLGAKAQFGEKYGDTVRVVAFGAGGAVPVSREFCGGCHVGSTSEIGAFRILSEGASSAGIRRLIAVAGDAARKLAAEETALAVEAGRHVGLAEVGDPHQVEDLARLFKAPVKDVPARVSALAHEVGALSLQMNATMTLPGGDLLHRVEHLLEELKRLRKIVESRQAQAAARMVDDLLEQVGETSGTQFVAAVAPGLDSKGLAALADALAQRSPGLVIALGAETGGKVPLLVKVPAELTKRGVSAAALLAAIAPLVGGRGGGRPDLAQGSGNDASRLAEALALVPGLVAKALG
ncbi:alanine--tRNA ligase [Planctomycetota bacterium]|nr:alanine--tRNA ligase [Planctomycetota bacterium]